MPYSNQYAWENTKPLMQLSSNVIICMSDQGQLFRLNDVLDFLSDHSPLLVLRNHWPAAACMCSHHLPTTLRTMSRCYSSSHVIIVQLWSMIGPALSHPAVHCCFTLSFVAWAFILNLFSSRSLNDWLLLWMANLWPRVAWLLTRALLNEDLPYWNHETLRQIDGVLPTSVF